jgi:hypothetical protein
MTRIFDVNGDEKSLAWLAETYDGCTVLPCATTGYREKWTLAAVYCTEGPAVIKIETRRGAAIGADQPVVVTWPSLADPSSELSLLPAYPHNWAARGVAQRTNSAGVVGFGLGSSYGPLYHVWVLSTAPSDCLSGTGMKGGTEHRGPLHGVWVLENVVPAFATLRDALLWHAAEEQLIEFNPAASLQKRIFADGFVPNSPEFDVEKGGSVYRGQRAEHLGSGEVRVYFAPVPNWNAVDFVVR